MPDWYYIGPDITGFSCSNCCAGFSIIGLACAPYPCSTNGLRNYICPPPANPTPHHIYAWDGVSANIVVNPLICSGGSTECYTYTGGPLNSAGRIGAGCVQTYVTSAYICESTYTNPPCNDPPVTCSCGQTPVITPDILYKSCESCSCVSTSSTVGTCGCTTVGAVCCNTCEGDPECEECCFTDLTYTEVCGDGTTRTCNTCTFTCFPEEPCQECTGDCGGECPECHDCKCVVGSSTRTCVSRSCASSCSVGYECSCGVCTCNTSSTCCVGFSSGWTYNSSTKQCVSCGTGVWTRTDCCDTTWKQKNCAAGKVCCNDGRCYDDGTVLCSLAN